MHEAIVNEFPFVGELPKREKSKLASLWDEFKEMSRIAEKKGIPVPPGLAAELLGVSRQRIYELMGSGVLETVTVGGRTYVTENSLVAWAEAEHKVGRPTKIEQAARMGAVAGTKEMLKMSRAYMQGERAAKAKK